MWKLAYCVQEKAGWPLLETYQTERRGVSQQITMQSLQNSMNVVRINAAAVAGVESGLTTEEAVAAARRYGNHLGVEFGAVYDSPAVVADGTRPPTVADSYSDYVPSATPGGRAPHVWLGRPDAQLSTLDLLGPAFTLLTAARGDAWLPGAAAAARDLGVPVHAYTIGSPGLADRGAFARAYELSDDGAVLVRPDGHVAWRSRSGPVAGTELTAALGRILAR
jgi:hypothetical protein